MRQASARARQQGIEPDQFHAQLHQQLARHKEQEAIKTAKARARQAARREAMQPSPGESLYSTPEVKPLSAALVRALHQKMIRDAAGGRPNTPLHDIGPKAKMAAELKKSRKIYSESRRSGR